MHSILVSVIECREGADDADQDISDALALLDKENQQLQTEVQWAPTQAVCIPQPGLQPVHDV